MAAAILAIATVAAVTTTGSSNAAASHGGRGLLGPVVALARPTVSPLPAAIEHKASARRNREPKPDYFGTCAQRGFKDQICIDQAIAAIEHARKHDHRIKKVAVILPDNFRRLSVAEQTFVIINLERVDRGIRPLEGLVPRLNALAHAGANFRLDPTIGYGTADLLGIGRWTSIWASDLGPLASDYDWMYNDGYGPTGSINVACSTPSSPGCWGHRHNILNKFKGFPTVVAGAGSSKPAGSSIAELSAGIRRHAPQYSYTWKEALKHGANGHKVLAGG